LQNILKQEVILLCEHPLLGALHLKECDTKECKNLKQLGLK